MVPCWACPLAPCGPCEWVGNVATQADSGVRTMLESDSQLKTAPAGAQTPGPEPDPQDWKES